MWQVGFLYPHAVVGNLQYDVVIIRVDTQSRFGFLATVFETVDNKVGEHLVQPGRVPHHHGHVGRLGIHLDAALRVGGPKRPHHRQSQGQHVHRGFVESGFFAAGEAEQVFHQQAHAGGLFLYLFHHHGGVGGGTRPV